MKIAFTGSHGTGKTTILDLMSGEKIHEQARKLIGEIGNPIDMKPPEVSNFQSILLCRQIGQEIIRDSFISDRSIFDILAYSKGLDCYDSLHEICKNYLEKYRYDLILYFPIEFGINDDGVRPTDIEYQKSIDSNILELLDEFGVKYETISGKIDQRIAKINSLVP